MSKGALAFIAGLGSGYLNQQQREEDQARRDKIDKISLDRADREKQEYDDKQALKAKIGEASKPGEVSYKDVNHTGFPLQSAHHQAQSFCLVLSSYWETLEGPQQVVVSALQT